MRKKTSFSVVFRIKAVLFAFVFLVSSSMPAVSLAQAPASAAGGSAVLGMPLPGTMVGPSEPFTPVLLKGITLHPENPFRFDFIVEPGDQKLDDDALQRESVKLIKYFLSSLTIPEDEMWVNLSPHESQRITPDSLGVTEMGRDLLTQDYVLKQLTASLAYPEDALGKEFWQTVRTKALARFGVSDIPLETFNKVWIVPDDAVVYVHEKSVFVVKSHLKVMMEQDYLALEKSTNAQELPQANTSGDINEVTSKVVKEILIPEIEKEVNEGENFKNLRQIYNSMILAVWYKKHLKKSLLGQVYVDKRKTVGVDVADKEIKYKIYDQYVQAFKKGVYSYIKEEYDPQAAQVIPRKYFSGGAVGVREVRVKDALAFLDDGERESLPTSNARVLGVDVFGVNILPQKGPDVAMISDDGKEKDGDYGRESNPYALEEYVCRACTFELDPAYDIINTLNERKEKSQKMLLVGVGRGVAALELAMRYPNLEIWAVNKEEYLWNDAKLEEMLVATGYAISAVQQARKRVHVIALDILDRQERKRLLGKTSFDLAFFEPRTQIYFEDKVEPIESIFNELVGVGGVYGFVVNSIFTSDERFAASDFGSPLFERYPDPVATQIVKRSLSSKALFVGERKLGGNLYLRFQRTEPGPVDIPLRWQRNERMTTPLGLNLVWSMYQIEEGAQAEGAKSGLDVAMLGDEDVTLLIDDDGFGMEEEAVLEIMAGRLHSAQYSH